MLLGPALRFSFRIDLNSEPPKSVRSSLPAVARACSVVIDGNNPILQPRRPLGANGKGLSLAGNDDLQTFHCQVGKPSAVIFVGEWQSADDFVSQVKCTQFDVLSHGCFPEE